METIVLILNILVFFFLGYVVSLLRLNKLIGRFNKKNLELIAGPILKAAMEKRPTPSELNADRVIEEFQKIRKSERLMGRVDGRMEIISELLVFSKPPFTKSVKKYEPEGYDI